MNKLNFKLKDELKYLLKYGTTPTFGLKSGYLNCIEHCGNLETAGMALDQDALVDYSIVETTPDQIRIETVLKTLDWQGKNLLHVGVGNSQLAKNFASGLNLLNGLTVSVNEKNKADSLGLKNYRVYLISKYSRDLVLLISDKYDFIVDNNLASFACCKFHFYQMMDTYLWALKPGGQILTDQTGMNWFVGDPRWRLTYRDLVRMEKVFPIKVSKMTNSVYSLKRL
ncbi:MAG: hypothetical protein WCA35_04195 [Kovacikia sp.]